MIGKQTRTSERWIPELPAGWQVVPAKSIFRERREPCGLGDVHLTPSQTFGVLPQARYMELTGNRVVLNIAGQETMKHVEPDDFIIHLRSFQGGLEWSPLAGKVSTAYTVIYAHSAILPDFYRWVLKSSGYVQELRTTTNQLRDGQSIKFRDFAKVSLPMPSIAIQSAVANYLARETAQIDTLIGKQERLVEMLRERRSAVIAWASTKGIDPGVNLVESGLGWVGEIPEHWQLGPTKRALHIERRLVGSEWSKFQLLSLTKRGVVPRDINSGEGKFPTSFEDYQVVEANDLIFCLFDIDETPRTVGLARQAGMVTGAYTRFIVRREVADPRFLAYFYIAIDDEKRFRPLYTGLRKVIQKSRFLGARLPLPPLAEQGRIADYLDTKTAEIDTLILKVERFIELSKERRAALITAAVTGQIDVRDQAAGERVLEGIS